MLNLVKRRNVLVVFIIVLILLTSSVSMYGVTIGYYNVTADTVYGTGFTYS